MTDHYHKATVLYDLGRYDEALESFNIARTEMPDDERPLCWGAFCYYFTGRAKQGLNFAREALALNPQSVQGHQASGLCLSKMGKIKLAEKSFLKAIEIDPENGFSHYYYAFHLSQSRSWDKALVELEVALKYEPDIAVIQVLRSKALTILGKKNEARSASLEALRLNPEESSAHTQQGLVLRIEGDVVGAMKAYREALRNDPNDREAREGLMDLIRSRFFVYRWLLSFELQIQRMSGKSYGVLSIVPITLARLALTSTFQEMDPATRATVRVAGVVYVFLLISTWFAPVFMDGLIALNSEMKYVLTRPQRTYAVRVTAAFLFAVAGLVIGYGFHLDIALFIAFLLTLGFVFFGVRYRITRW